MKATLAVLSVLVSLVGIAHAGGFCQPVLEWAWVGVIDAPETPWIQFTPMVADLNGDGIADVVFAHRNSGDTEIVITGLDGRTGSVILDIDGFDANNSLALGDIDNDGLIEIIVMNGDKTRLLAFENDGTLKWTSDPVSLQAEVYIPSPIGIADIDQDGSPEMIFGNAVFDANGTLKWKGFAGSGRASTSYNVHASNCVELDANSPGLEVLAGNTVYASDGQVIWNRSDIGDGWTAVTDFGNDGSPEVILNSETVYPIHELYVLDGITGQTIGTPYPLVKKGWAQPVVADLDGDCRPEVLLGTLGTGPLTALKWDGANFSIYWETVPIDLSGVATPSVFDINGDGYPEILYPGTNEWVILDGRTGQIISSTPHRSTTADENIVIADLDSDGHAELIVPSLGGSNTDNQIAVYSCSMWAPARPIWNQFEYHVTNINDDGSVPVVEKAPWQYGVGWFEQARDEDIAHPSPVGNTLHGVKTLPTDVTFSWALVGTTQYELYRETTKGIWTVPYLTVPSTTAQLFGDLLSPPNPYYYQVLAVDCVGTERAAE
ncbi:MAG: hypothetical protein A3A33_00170 [Candidatus Yanofskybacteria bacterium RIFCSPLOWO2_01_FULL_49_25]|uniref:Fibronectin type-III domain-containing protein n=1 Tax=Candidatus Yanofskybacteria bacterium RIFCSPLOWO2_01_FULL_49_25 TaxID=1802701 RepID=A0A1F8GX85_9BACT|nr:MAG: hypothetical protein A3A33_00170 [Candidatus Yanofskybacteria bacterium RIFCSPLOWO2_01_FULL_49_25]